MIRTCEFLEALTEPAKKPNPVLLLDIDLLTCYDVATAIADAINPLPSDGKIEVLIKDAMTISGTGDRSVKPLTEAQIKQIEKDTNGIGTIAKLASGPYFTGEATPEQVDGLASKWDKRGNAKGWWPQFKARSNIDDAKHQQEEIVSRHIAELFRSIQDGNLMAFDDAQASTRLDGWRDGAWDGMGARIRRSDAVAYVDRCGLCVAGAAPASDVQADNKAKADAALLKHDGNKTKAAAELEIDRRTLSRWIDSGVPRTKHRTIKAKRKDDALGTWPHGGTIKNKLSD